MKKDDLPSYVYKQKNLYHVQRYKDGKPIVYGKFRKREDAIQLRNKLIQDATLKERRGKHRIKDWQNRYIKKTYNGKYAVQKKVNGEYQHFGTYKTLEDARDERDYLEGIGWDYDEME